MTRRMVGYLMLIAGATVFLADGEPAGSSVLAFLKNEELYKNCMACLLGNDKCSPPFQLIKDNLELALKYDCKDCPTMIRAGAIEAIRFMLEHKPEDFKRLETIYDPEGEFRKRLAQLQISQLPLPK